MGLPTTASEKKVTQPSIEYNVNYLQYNTAMEKNLVERYSRHHTMQHCFVYTYM